MQQENAEILAAVYAEHGSKEKPLYVLEYQVPDSDDDEIGILVFSKPSKLQAKEFFESLLKDESQANHHLDLFGRKVTVYPSKGAALNSLFDELPLLAQRVAKNAREVAEGRVPSDAKKYKPTAKPSK